MTPKEALQKQLHTYADDSGWPSDQIATEIIKGLRESGFEIVPVGQHTNPIPANQH
jgi:hypothetical protein